MRPGRIEDDMRTRPGGFFAQRIGMRAEDDDDRTTPRGKRRLDRAPQERLALVAQPLFRLAHTG